MNSFYVCLNNGNEYFFFTKNLSNFSFEREVKLDRYFTIAKHVKIN